LGGQNSKKSETKMHYSHNSHHGGAECASPLIVCDLRAQIAPLNRYGLPGLGAAVADGARALIGVSRSAVTAVVARNAALAPRTEH
jgi:hypothetical protein